MLPLPLLATAVVLVSASVAAAATPAETARKVLSSPVYLASVAQMDREHERVVSEIVTLTEIPAPPFKEAKRAALIRHAEGTGLQDVEIDSMAMPWAFMRHRRAGGPSSSCRPPRHGLPKKRWSRSTQGTASMPRIGDDTRSLAVLLAYARA